MNTADLAVIAVTVVGLVNIAANHRVHMRLVDRIRVVNPVKPPADPARTEAKAAPPALVPGMKEVA